MTGLLGLWYTRRVTLPAGSYKVPLETQGTATKVRVNGSDYAALRQESHPV